MKKLLLSLLLVVVLTTPAFAGASRSFDGNDYIDLGAPASLDITNFSVCAWFNGNSFASYSQIVCKTPITGTTRNFELSFDGASHLRGVFTQGVGGYKVTNGSTALSTGVWYFGCTAYDGAALKVYLNGVEDGTGAFSGSADTTTGSAVIGRLGDLSADHFNGKAAYVHIYNRGITQVEVTQLMYRPGSVTSGLVAYLPLWGVHSPEIDLSGTGNSGTVNGATESTDGPPVFIGAGGN